MLKSSEKLKLPTYTLSTRLVLDLVWAILFKRSRNFKRDAARALKGLRPALAVSGQAFIPEKGPGLITFNHYYRPGFNAYWMSLAISAVLPGDVFWIMTGAFTYPGQRREMILKPMSYQLLHRIGQVYGFTNMPAMPPDPKEVSERALAVRQVVAYVRQHKDAVIGLAPEGRDILTGQLGDPPGGSGRFIQHLARLGFPILPLGVFEAGGSLHLAFGRPYCLETPAGLSPAETDAAVSGVVMRAIARQLPVEMRGRYA